MIAETLTTALVGTTAVLLIVWDVYVCQFNDVPNRRDSISGQMKRYGERMRSIPFGWGMLGGHFWLPGEPIIDKPWSLFLLGIVAFVVAVIPGKRWGAPLALLLGVLCGRLLWPQS